MYSRSVTQRAIDATNAVQGWDLEPHSAVQVESAIAHFDNLLDVETGAFTRQLTPDEQRFIQNERRLCALDFRYWVEHYAYIISMEKRPMIFKSNIAQEIVLHIWAEFEDAGRAIHLQQLKARRLGVSTISELAVQHRFQFQPYANCVVASADPGKSVVMADMIDFSHQHQPWWLIPPVTKVHKGIPAEHGAIHTALTIQAGNQFNGVARGATPSVVHLSELAEWQDAESLVDAALYRAIIDTPNVFCILESTAEGRGNWWHRTWEQNKKDWGRGRGRIRPIFLPWYVGVDLYPSVNDLHNRPVPADWHPTDRVIRHAERAREYVLANPLLFKYLAKENKDWQLPRAQMWWYEIEYETAKDKKELNIFLSELPADDHEAFQSDKITIIDTEIIQSYRERCREPWGVFTILGPDIPNALCVPQRYWDRQKNVIPIRTSALIRMAETYYLQPLKWDGYQSATDPALCLFVWDPPEDGKTFGVGVDTSDGVGQDNSVIQCVRQGSMGECAGQVAEFASSYIKAFQLWPMVLALSCWYSTFNQNAQRRTQCRVAIECRGNGEATQFEMQKRGWYNFHPWKKYDNRKRTADKDAHKLGVFTMEWWRSQMMDYILTLIDEEALDVPSPWLVDEMQSLERDWESQKVKAVYGEHEDRFMALGFVLFSMDVERIRHRRYNVNRGPTLAPPREDDDETMRQPHPIWTPGIQARDLGHRPVIGIERSLRGQASLGAGRPRSGQGW